MRKKKFLWREPETHQVISDHTQIMNKCFVTSAHQVGNKLHTSGSTQEGATAPGREQLVASTS